MNIRTVFTRTRVASFIFVVALLLGAVSLAIPTALPGIGKVSAVNPACSTDTLSSLDGSASQAITVNTAGSYRLWSRLQATSDTANSFYLKIDDGCMYTVGDSTQIPLNSWTWVNYRDGNTLLPLDIDLTAGTHTLTYIAREADVKVDTVLALADKTCVPEGLGANCKIVDTTAPLVSIISPAPDASASGIVQVRATVYDVSEITKVEFYVDGQLQSTVGRSAEYSFAWDTASVVNGTHSLQVKAYDDAILSNVGESEAVPVVARNKPAVGALDLASSLIVDKAAIAPGDTISATAVYKNTSDFPVTVNDIMLSARMPGTANPRQAGYFAADSHGPYTVAPGQTIEITGRHTANSGDMLGTYWAYAEYVDEAGTVHSDATETSFTLAALDTTSPELSFVSPLDGTNVPQGNALPVIVQATDDIGVSKVEIFVDGALRSTLTSAPYQFSWDTSGADETVHSLTAKAYDTRQNATLTEPVHVTVLPPLDTIRPSVTINSPGTGASVAAGSKVPISVTADDNIRVTKVELYVDDQLKTTFQDAPYAYSWDTINDAVGVHSVVAKAYDAAGNVQTSAVTTVSITPPPDTSSPSIIATAPAAVSTAVSGEIITVTADALDNVGVSKVELYVDNTLHGSKAVAPYTYTWNTSEFAVGIHTISLKAYDAAGNSAETPLLAVMLLSPPDTTKPMVAMSSPVAGMTVVVGSMVAIRADATDNVGITKVEFTIDSLPRSEMIQPPYGYDWNTAASNLGAHTLLVRATDAAGNVSESSLTVNLVAPPDTTQPTVSITDPGPSTIVVTGMSVAITAIANDNIGVIKVEVSVDGVIKQALAAPPYTYSWNTTGASLGAHVVTAKASDAAGNTATTGNLMLTVVPPPDTTKPTISITSPGASTSAVIGTNIAVAATANDNVGVTKVEFYVDGAIKASPTTAPYGFSWNTTGAGLGVHSVVAKAYDAAGNNSSSSPASITVSPPPDTTKPTVAITSPTAGASVVVGNTVAISVAASDNIGVAKVELKIDGIPRSESQSSPYAFSWNTVASTLGAHTILIRASDATGNFAESSVTINLVAPLDTTKPTVAITAPAPGTNIITGSTATIMTAASDNIAVTKVELSIDGVLKATLTASPYNYSWNTTGVSLGTHTVAAKAYDAAGNTTTTAAYSLNVVIPPDTTKPVVSLASPAVGASIIAGSTVSIAANATDNIKVTKVEYYVDGVLKGNSTVTPYAYSWSTSGVSAASHAITAKAYDAAGNNATTAATTVSIVEAPGTGLAAVYYNNSDLTGTTFSRTDPTIGFDWGTGSPNTAIAADTFSARWTGFVKPTKTESYTFYTYTDDGVRLWVNGVLLVNNWIDHAVATNSGKINLVAGQKYTIKMEYYDNTGGAVAKLLWATPTITQQIIPQSQLYPN